MLWLQAAVALVCAAAGGKPTRYRLTLEPTLEEGERAVAIKGPHFSFIAEHCRPPPPPAAPPIVPDLAMPPGVAGVGARAAAAVRRAAASAAQAILAGLGPAGASRVTLLWQLIGPDHPHGDKKANNQPHALQRVLVLGNYLVSLSQLLPLAAMTSCAWLPRLALTHFDKQKHATALAVLDKRNVEWLDEQDAASAAKGERRTRCGTAEYLRYNGELARATAPGVLPVSERLTLAMGALLFLSYWHIFIVSSKPYTLERNFMSDQSYHDQVLRCGSLMMWIVAQALSPACRLPFTPREHGEQACEDVFGETRSGHGSDRAPSFDMLVDRLQRAAFRLTQRFSGLVMRNREGVRLDAEAGAHAEGAPAPPSLASELGCVHSVDFETLESLFAVAGQRALLRVRKSVTDLGMLRVLLAAGCSELGGDAPSASPFRLQQFSGPCAPPSPAPPAAEPDAEGVIDEAAVALASLAEAEDAGRAPVGLIVAAADRMHGGEVDAAAALLASLGTASLESTVYEEVTTLDMLAAAAAFGSG